MSTWRADQVEHGTRNVDGLASDRLVFLTYGKELGACQRQQ